MTRAACRRAAAWWRATISSAVKRRAARTSRSSTAPPRGRLAASSDGEHQRARASIASRGASTTQRSKPSPLRRRVSASTASSSRATARADGREPRRRADPDDDIDVGRELGQKRLPRQGARRRGRSARPRGSVRPESESGRASADTAGLRDRRCPEWVNKNAGLAAPPADLGKRVAGECVRDEAGDTHEDRQAVEILRQKKLLAGQDRNDYAGGARRARRRRLREATRAAGEEEPSRAAPSWAYNVRLFMTTGRLWGCPTRGSSDVRVVAICQDELVIRTLNDVLQAELRARIPRRKPVRWRGGSTTPGCRSHRRSPKRVDTYLKADISPTTCFIVEDNGKTSVKKICQGHPRCRRHPDLRRPHRRRRQAAEFRGAQGGVPRRRRHGSVASSCGRRSSPSSADR